MPTRSKSVRARAGAPRRAPTRSCSRIASTTCAPTVSTGIQARHRLLEDHRDVGAAHAAQLGDRQREHVLAARCAMRPASMRPGFGTRRRIESAVIDLPQPDSPTSASVSPASSARSTRSTTGARPAARRGKLVDEALDLEHALAHCALPQRARVEDVAHRVADEVHGEDQAEERAATPRRRFHQMTGSRESSSRAWSIIWPQLPSMPMPSQESDRLGEHEAGEDQHEGDHDEVHQVRQDVAQQDAQLRDAERARGLHVVELAQLERLAAHEPRRSRPSS